MSTTIDQQVVEMRFDNKHFESNVKTTMSTLEKLKARLDLSGASKGLESVNVAAKNCNIASIGSAVDGVKVKFSALQVAAVTCLQNITNQAVNAGKRIVSSLTIEPITTGFNEYELKMNSVQTIMASTGENLETVNQYLNELNKYSDETIYSFSDMTQNIGKFTNAGIKLEDAVVAIKGIANEAALSGANANEAARAMYNFSQALSTGYVQRIDWKSIELANMATVEFKEQLLEKAVAMKTVKKNAEGMYAAINDDKYYNTSQMFIESLDEQWLTSEVLIETLKDYADTTTDIGKRATEAATEVKTFSHMMDTLKESAQSGWAQTWELIFGDFDEGKTLWTRLNKVIGGVIDKMSDHRNKNLGEALNSNWEKLTIKIRDAGVETSDFEKSVSDALKAGGHDVDAMLKEYGSLEKIFTSGAASSDILKEAIKALNGSIKDVGETIIDLSGIDRILGFGTVGDDVKKAQDALEKLGYTLERFGVDGIIGAETTAAIRQFQTDKGLKVDGIIGPETIAALEEAAAATGELTEENKGLIESYEDLVDAIDKSRGRELVIESFVKVFEKFKPLIESFKSTWEKVFGNFPSVGEVLSGLIEDFADFADRFQITEDKIKNMTDAFEGLLRIGELAAIMSGGAFGFLVKVIKTVGSELGADFWNLAGNIGRAIVQIRNWLVVDNPLHDGLLAIAKGVIGFVKNTSNAIKNWINAFSNLPYITNLLNGVRTAFENTLKNIDTVLGIFVSSFKKFIDTVCSGNVASAFNTLFSDMTTAVDTGYRALIELFGKLKDLIIAFFAELANNEGTPEKFQENFTKIETAINKVLNPIRNAINRLRDLGLTFRDWIVSLKDVDDLPTAIGEGIGRALGSLVNYIKDSVGQFAKDIWKGMTGAGEDGVSGLVNGIKNGVTKVISAVKDIATALITSFCDTLQIHSPSKVMMALGAFVIAGLVKGILDGDYTLWEAVSGVGTTIIDTFKTVFDSLVAWLKALDFGTLLVGGIGVGTLLVANKIADALKSFGGIADSISGVIKATAGVVKNFSGVLKSVSLNLKAKAVKDFAISLAILVGAIVALAYVCGREEFNVWEAVGVITVLAGVLIGLAWAASSISKSAVEIDKSGAKVSGMTGLLGIAAAILIVALAVKLIDSIDPERCAQAFWGLAGVFVALAAMMGVCVLLNSGKFKGGMDNVGDTLLKISGAILILAIVAKMLSGMSTEGLAKAAAGMAGMVGVIALLMTISMIPGKNVDKIGDMLIKIAGAMAILVIVAKMIARMEWADMGKAAVGLLGLVGIITLLSVITMLPGAKSGKLGSTLMGIAGAMAILAVVAKIIASMEWEDMGKAAIGLLGLVYVVGILVGIVELAGKDAPKIAGTLLALSASIGILAVVAALLSSVSVENLTKGITAIGLLAGVMTAMIWATRGASDCKGNLIAMTVAIGIMAAAIVVLSFMDPSKLAGATIALSIVMGMFALIVLASKNVTTALLTIVVMTAAVAALAGVLAMLSGLPAESTIGAAIALSVLMLAMAGVLAILSIIGGAASSALMGVVALLAMAVPLIAFVGVLAVMQNVKNAMDNVIALSVLATVMTLLLIPLMLVGALVPVALMGVVALLAMAVPLIAFVGVLAVMQLVKKATENTNLLITLTTAMTLLLIPLTLIGALATFALVGVAALLAMALPMLAFVGVLAIMDKIQNATTNAYLLIDLMTAMSDILVKIAIVAPLAHIGVSALASLSVLMLEIGAFAVVLGGIMKLIPGLQSFLDTGIGVLEQLAAGIGSIVASIINGFVNGLDLSGLPKIATQLSAFMVALTPFIVGVKMFDESAVVGAGMLAAVILALSAANLITGMRSFMSIGSSFADLGTQLSDFMRNAMPFIVGAKMIDESVMKGVRSLAETLLILTGVNVLEGLTSWFAGEVSLADFGAELESFGPSIAKFGESVADINPEAIKAAADAAKTLGEMASNLPNTGGFLGDLIGDNTMDEFGNQLEGLGKSLKKYSDAVVGIDIEAMKNSATAAQSLSDLANSLPNTGGFLADLVGDNTMDEWGYDLRSFGKSITAYSQTVVGLNTESITNSATAAQSLSDLANNLPNSGGFLAKLAGDNGMDAWGIQLTSFGNSLVSYADSVVDLNAASIANSVTAAKSLGDLARNLPDGAGFFEKLGGKEDIASFGKKLVKFGEAMDAYGDSVAGINVQDLSAATTEFRKITNLLKGMGDVDFASASEFGATLGTIGEAGVDKFVEAFSNSSSKVVKTGEDMVSNVEKGAQTKNKTLSSSFVKMVSDAIAGIRGKYQNFYEAGAYLVKGFANGINANIYLAKAKARAMAAAAASAARAELDEHSPSKVGYEIGDFFGIAFVNAISDNIKDAYTTSKELAKSARTGLSDAVSKVHDFITSDIDAQPTIRPILDLSDVKAGANTIGSMFGVGPSVGVLTNVGRINTMMNGRSQNGVNDDVVSAIDKLRRDIGSLERNVYNVGGVTYDDGSNIASAVQTLAHAALMGRRT